MINYVKASTFILMLTMLLSGCTSSKQVTYYDDEYPDNVPQSRSSIRPTQSAGVTPTLSSTSPLSSPSPITIREATPFPDDGKSPSYMQSKEFPQYALTNPAIPKQLYTYAINQGLFNNLKISLVPPVDFYNQTKPDLRSKLLVSFKSFVTQYYNLDYKNTEPWKTDLRKFLDPKQPVSFINGKDPETFLLETANLAENRKLKTSIVSIITDDSLIYLDTNAHYRIRGRITVRVDSSDYAELPVGQQNLDIEVAFREKLLSGPKTWASEALIATLLFQLK